LARIRTGVDRFLGERVDGLEVARLDLAARSKDASNGLPPRVTPFFGDYISRVACFESQLGSTALATDRT
jgi:hypothetical protein